MLIWYLQNFQREQPYKSVVVYVLYVVVIEHSETKPKKSNSQKIQIYCSIQSRAREVYTRRKFVLKKRGIIFDQKKYLRHDKKKGFYSSVQRNYYCASTLDK